MSSRIVIGNRVVASTERRPLQRLSAIATQVHAGYSTKDGEFVDTRPIASNSPHTPFRAGFAYTDPETDITFRIVNKLDIQEGWGTVDFWIERYGLFSSDKDSRVEPGYGLKFIREWCARGWMDAAMEEHVPTARYRVRDERRIYTHLWDLHNTRNSLGPGTKAKIRAALQRLAPLFK